MKRRATATLAIAYCNQNIRKVRRFKTTNWWSMQPTRPPPRLPPRPVAWLEPSEAWRVAGSVMVGAALEACLMALVHVREEEVITWPHSRFARHCRPRGGAMSKCAVCRKSFQPARADANTCSSRCRQKAYRKRLSVTRKLAAPVTGNLHFSSQTDLWATPQWFW